MSKGSDDIQDYSIAGDFTGADGAPLADDSPVSEEESIALIGIDPAFKGRYQFLSKLGAGGMGVVYKARKLSSGKLVAIKTMHPIANSAAAIQRFEVEAEFLSRLRHPNIVTLLEFGTMDNDVPYMVLEFAEGRNLAEILAEEGQLDTDRVLHIFMQVCAALKHAHATKILHRDMKPSNLMLMPAENAGEHVYLMDFGIGKAFSRTDVDAQRLTRKGEFVGTPTYMSPEQAQGHQVDERSDLYSLGCIMYEALTGSPPFISKSLLGAVIQHKRAALLSIPEASMGRAVDPRLESIVVKLLEKDPKSRFQSVDELGKALAQVQAGAQSARQAGAGVEAATVTAPAKMSTPKVVAEAGPSPRAHNSPRLGLIALAIAALIGIVLVAALIGPFGAGMPAGSGARKPSLERSSLPADPGKTSANGSQTKPHSSPSEETSIPTKGTAQSGSTKSTQSKAESEANVVDTKPSSSGPSTASGNQQSEKNNKGKETESEVEKTAGAPKSPKSPKSEPMTIFSEAMPPPGEETMFRRQIVARAVARKAHDYFLGNQFFPYSDDDLQPMRDAKSATSVLVTGREVTDKGLENLSHLRLKTLKLSHTSVKDLHALKNMTSLEILDLSDTPLTADAFLVLRNMRNLQNLVLDATPTTDRDLQQLNSLTELGRLSILRCRRISEDGVLELHKHLPDCGLISEFRTHLADADSNSDAGKNSASNE